MLNNREISELFEVQINTLYNWQKTKPKLYKYLQNADYNYNRNQEINVLLDEYSRDIKKDFLPKEIEYIIKTAVELSSIEDVKIFHKIFIECEYKNIPHNRDNILLIYDKISKLNIIEKYIFYKKIYKYRKNSKFEKNEILKVFKEFLS